MLLPKRWMRIILLSACVFAVTVWSLWLGKAAPAPVLDAAAIERAYPLAWKHINDFNGTGGAWFIPPEWIANKPEPQTIVEAARLAAEVAASQPDREADYSRIPLIVHQTSKSARVNTWKPEVLPWVEQWLRLSVPSTHNKRPMAYFFWDDDGILDFMREFESDMLGDFNAMFTPVERADIFRVLACKWFGGVYADVDTEPLRHPATWITAPDVARWTDDVTGRSYGIVVPPGDNAVSANTRPVKLLWGLEADTDPESDAYWRMGYTYPVQVTQWALASAPKHPVLTQFVDNLKAQIRKEKESPKAPVADPLTRTGPAAVTLATSMWLEKEITFRWNAVTGLKDGGKSKLASDVLVLPITGFSPGRGKYGNMGSKPVGHPDARLVHHALGSWRHFDVWVEYGKFCRTVFGLCRDWSKVPSS
ncbi:glycosyl transferase [Purpureocillium lilacinum]|uniref:Glycosyl transferase n=2 Tax=Purpureocillium lilacinum TaxID=33203 RepID=A0A179GVE5_PURLI|nr:glycosyl transferase [Purpureocillium lilacinum]OAQ81290.1 glycosyl transferase [Purpureocillium lilacinum]